MLARRCISVKQSRPSVPSNSPIDTGIAILLRFARCICNTYCVWRDDNEQDISYADGVNSATAPTRARPPSRIERCMRLQPSSSPARRRMLAWKGSKPSMHLSSSSGSSRSAFFVATIPVYAHAQKLLVVNQGDHDIGALSTPQLAS